MFWSCVTLGFFSQCIYLKAAVQKIGPGQPEDRDEAVEVFPLKKLKEIAANSSRHRRTRLQNSDSFCMNVLRVEGTRENVRKLFSATA
jgi:hypothetical protein